MTSEMYRPTQMTPIGKVIERRAFTAVGPEFVQ